LQDILYAIREHLKQKAEDYRIISVQVIHEKKKPQQLLAIFCWL